jgi:hypothetical protein
MSVTASGVVRPCTRTSERQEMERMTCSGGRQPLVPPGGPAGQQLLTQALQQPGALRGWPDGTTLVVK